MLMALTVFIISASYSQTIDLFPTGGGGYLVATKLLGKYFGLVSGSALVVDYVLTIAISIASGADAIFSFLPVSWLPYKFWLCLLVVVLMVLMNLRGVKESVLSLLPIFLAFIVMHVWLVGYAILSRAPELPSIVGHAVREVHASAHSLGMLALLVIFFRAYSLGGGTYTGIEAVSNGLPILREPRAETGKRTMIYMAVSLAFVAGGILLGYLLLNVEAETGKTLNAVMFERLASNWQLFGLHVGPVIITFALLTEGALLFVAAQTGFVDGPRVLATMASDRWLPRRFANLSARLVTQDGVITIGLAAIAASHRHRGAGRLAGRPLCDQRVRDVHAFAARDDDALVARAQDRKAMAAQADHQRRRHLLHRDDPDDHADAQVLRGRMGDRRDHRRPDRAVLHGAAPLRAGLEGDRAARGRHPAETVRGQKAGTRQARSQRADRRDPGQRLQRSRAGDADRGHSNCSRASSATWSSSESAKWMRRC